MFKVIQLMFNKFWIALAVEYFHDHFHHAYDIYARFILAVFQLLIMLMMSIVLANIFPMVAYDFLLHNKICEQEYISIYTMFKRFIFSHVFKNASICNCNVGKGIILMKFFLAYFPELMVVKLRWWLSWINLRYVYFV
jgi:hypothetical protein